MNLTGPSAILRETESRLKTTGQGSPHHCEIKERGGREGLWLRLERAPTGPAETRALAALVLIFSWPLRDLRRARRGSPGADEAGLCAYVAIPPPKPARVLFLDGAAPDASDTQLADKTMTSRLTESGPLLGGRYLLVERSQTLGLGTGSPHRLCLLLA